jgi:hypothetical protein
MILMSPLIIQQHLFCGVTNSSRQGLSVMGHLEAGQGHQILLPNLRSTRWQAVVCESFECACMNSETTRRPLDSASRLHSLLKQTSSSSWNCPCCLPGLKRDHTLSVPYTHLFEVIFAPWTMGYQSFGITTPTFNIIHVAVFYCVTTLYNRLSKKKRHHAALLRRINNPQPESSSLIRLDSRMLPEPWMVLQGDCKLLSDFVSKVRALLSLEQSPFWAMTSYFLPDINATSTATLFELHFHIP